MYAGLFGILLILIVLAMCTLGSVLLAALFLSSYSRGARVAAAAIGAPSVLAVPTWIYAAFDNPAELTSVMLALIVMTGFASVFVGWPVAHVATKRLDRLTQFDLETFE